MVHQPCIGYAIIFTDEAKKDLKKLDKQILLKILEKVKILASSKFESLNIKKLRSKNSLYRLRVADYCLAGFFK